MMTESDFKKLVQQLSQSVGLPASFQGGVFEAFILGIKSSIAFFSRELIAKQKEPAEPQPMPKQEQPKVPQKK
jgi:hypothetical protein